MSLGEQILLKFPNSTWVRFLVCSRPELKVMSRETVSKLYILIYRYIYMSYMCRQVKINLKFKLQIVYFSFCSALSFEDVIPGWELKLKGEGDGDYRRWEMRDGQTNNFTLNLRAEDVAQAPFPILSRCLSSTFISPFWFKAQVVLAVCFINFYDTLPFMLFT